MYCIKILRQNLLIFVIILMDKSEGQPVQSLPGLTLQDTLDRLQAEIDNIKDKVSTAIRVLQNFHTPSDQMRTLESQNHQLKTELLHVENYMFSMEHKISRLDESIGNIGRKIDESMTDVQNQLGILGSSTVKQLGQFDKANQMWKRNFKIVNKAFKALKRKIQFRVPVVKA